MSSVAADLGWAMAQQRAIERMHSSSDNVPGSIFIFERQAVALICAWRLAAQYE